MQHAADALLDSMIMRAFYDYFLSLRTLRMPVVAAINGHAIGAGFCISLFADMRVAAKDAKMGFNFVNLGLHPVRHAALSYVMCMTSCAHRALVLRAGNG